MSVDSNIMSGSKYPGEGSPPSEPAFRPAGIWTRSDFLINKHYWEKCGVGMAAEIRRKNLIEIRRHLQSAGIRNFLIGKTLRGIVRTGAFEDDNDDDFGIYVEDRARLLEEVAPLLTVDGYSLIRSNDEMISFERGFRYIDICLFRKATAEGRAKFGYANKWHDAEHFESLAELTIFGEVFDIPMDAENLLRKAYDSGADLKVELDRKAGGKGRKGRRNRGRLGSRVEAEGVRGLRGKGNPERRPRLYRGVSVLRTLIRKSVRKLKMLPLRLAEDLNWIHGVLPVFASRLVDSVSATNGENYKILTEAEFRDILIEPNESYNWVWRKRHLDLVTDSGRYRKVEEIIQYLADTHVRLAIEKNLHETDTSIRVLEPINRDMDFWWGGNNFFWNCVKYGFRKEVIPYSEAREYIESGRRPLLYTGAYYDSLPIMTDAETRRLLLKHPIEITEGAVTSGKHRAFAMIGRIVAGKPYLPVRAKIRPHKAVRRKRAQ